MAKGRKNYGLIPVLVLLLSVWLVLILAACSDQGNGPTPTPTLIKPVPSETTAPPSAAVATTIPPEFLITIPPLNLNPNNAVTTHAANATSAPATVATPAPAPTQAQASLPGGQTNVPPVPAKSTFKPLNAGSDLEQNLASILPGGNQASSVQIFSTRDNFAAIVGYYNQALSRNYRQVGQQNLQSLTGPNGQLKLAGSVVIGYQNKSGAANDNIALVVTPPLTASYLSQVRSVAPNLASQLTTGDRLLVVIYNVPLGLG
ncbi:MAG TPA: hypothetical protein VH186_37660 [Chloroflexia bacterium]|nr:hypothetical protein [Chloroflexia bacterium]